LVALAAAALLAACGSDDAGESGASTAASAASTSAAPASDAFPVTVEHVYGETVIPAKPERIATVAWANHEVPLALGVVPVGMSKATWGDDDEDGVLPWVEAKLTELGAATPTLFDETDGIDFEAVANTKPDVILASYSGLTKEEYETLSKIAPTIAYPKIAWGTSVEEMILLNSAAMGMAAEGEQLVAELDAQVQATFASYPQLAGKSIVFTYIDPNDTSQVGFYTNHDTRPGFLLDLGMTTSQLVTDRSAATDAFYDTISAEEGDRLADADVLVTYGDDSTLAALQADALLAKIPAIERGAVAVLQNSTPLAASANPSPLSIGWNLDDYFALLAAAAGKA
jgi:iron complex transport system substrate-binding protein